MAPCQVFNEVCPGHDYKNRSVSTVEEERRFNPRLTKPLDEFVEACKTGFFCDFLDPFEDTIIFELLSWSGFGDLNP